VYYHHYQYASGRYCARCTYPMTALPVGHVWVDHCNRCGGSFFDWGEAAAALGQDADPTKWRPEAIARPPHVSRLPCPVGHGPMWSHLLRYEDKQVEVDTCGHCYGLWLDAHEAYALQAITGAVKTEHQRPGARFGTAGIVGAYLLQLVTAIPIEAHNPVKRKPVLVHGLVAILSVLFVLELVLIGAGREEVFMQFAFVSRAFESGHVYNVLTYAFLHGSIPHLLGNLYFLWIFGDNVEDFLGRKRFTWLYLGTAVIAGLAHWLGNLGSDQAMVGASGAIAGLMGAYFVLFPRVKVWVVIFFIPFKLRAIWYLLIWVGLQFLIMLDPKSNVAWLAHVGGFVGGLGMAYLLKPKALPAPPGYSLQPARA
jgi:membrane associated rhomboid family serine protease/Zn-finger nucleic acid-binding protein